ncbi:tetratricopeptide repeat protein [Ekhidna sp.]|uniref:tetratricopeptide repeat protein n=1 Tax=Ekhidna sp. TaxID=2608089 RepID=UPI003BACBE90
MSTTFKKIFTGIFLAGLISMLWAHHLGYDSSIDWEVTTTGEVIQFPAWKMESNLMTHEISGEKYLLQENYSGSEIKRDLSTDSVLLGIIWMGLCLFLVATTYLKRYAFFAVVALFAVLLNRLNLFEIGLFGLQSKLIILIPFILLITPLVIFHEYKKNTPLLIRIITLITLSGVILFGVNNSQLFVDHIIANSLFSFSICGLIFLFIISEEIVFSILYVITSGKGGKSNHLHFLALSLIYLGNLILYYLNKSGLYENSFFFFDPFILLAITSIVSLWSMKFKAGFLSKFLDNPTLFLITFSLGIITLFFLSSQMIRGNDAVYQAFHYFILYFHIGFGTLFFLYIIGNFIDPLIKGFEVHKIVYRERNFPYSSARLGGFFAILAFYFLAGQEPYNLLRSGYYNYLAVEAKTEENDLLAKEYTLQASYLGYNTHYANYDLGLREMERGDEYPAKIYFHSASQRFPSDYALVNYGNLDAEINPNKVQAIYEEALRTSSSGELENNLGVLLLGKGQLEQSLAYFEEANKVDEWNNAPLINKWHVYKRLEVIDSSSLSEDYLNGNFGVRSNMLTTQSKELELGFEFENLENAKPLHRQSYLLNSATLFNHDSIEAFTRRELENSSDGTFNFRLRKALAIHLYNKGEINKAFLMLDYLQANSHQFFKGEYLNALGKFALDQEAYQLALDFFERALEVKHNESLFGKIDALAHLRRSNEIPGILLKSLKKNPELTDQSNIVLAKLESFQVLENRKRDIPLLDSLDERALVKLGRMNAFHEDQVIAVVETLNQKGMSGGYELLVDATEINPYSIKLLKKYALIALDWNLIEYADQTLQKLETLQSPEDYNSFTKQYFAKKEELEDSSW